MGLVMFELGVFMKGFNYGRLMWLQGPAGTRKVRITYELLNFCLVKDSRVLQMSAHQFIDMLKVGSAKLYSNDYEVLIVRDFENLPRNELNLFLEAIEDYHRFKQFLEMRVILISSDNFERMKRCLKKLNPVIIRIRGVGDDPGELNERIHATIEVASRVTHKKVTRLSEAVATFLESFSWTKNDDDLLSTLVSALNNLEGTTLQIEHFFKKGEKKPHERSFSAFHKHL
jgi:hypothetical protein